MNRLSLFACIALLIAGCVITRPVQAQDYQEQRNTILKQQQNTRSQLEQLESLINTYQQELNRAEQRFDQIYTRYEEFKRLLALQRQKIATLQQEQQQVTREIGVTQKKLAQQEQKLEQLIKDYKKTMRYVYKNGRTSQLAVILSSASLNQMMIRNYYLKRFEAYREGQAADIRQTKQQLEESRQQLDAAAARNKEVLAQIRSEETKLQQQMKEQEENVNILSRNRLQLENKIAKSQREKQELNSMLTNLIDREESVRQAEEERRRRAQANSTAEATPSEASEAESRSAPTRSSAAAREYSGTVGYVTDEELNKIERSFAGLRGNLPWPVQSSTISEHFGRRRDPVYGTVTPNLGIEIVTDAEAPVKTVHDGYVFAVRPVAGYGDVVFVSHGKYKTAYGNLSQVLVRENTILSKGDVVGYAGDENSTRGKSVFFMLREGKQNIDPEQWLK